MKRFSELLIIVCAVCLLLLPIGVQAMGEKAAESQSSEPMEIAEGSDDPAAAEAESAENEAAPVEAELSGESVPRSEDELELAGEAPLVTDGETDSASSTDAIMVTLDANGGWIASGTDAVSAVQHSVDPNGTYGEALSPIPTFLGRLFLGWFSAAGDGEGTQVYEDSEPISTENHTLYAHWVDCPVPALTAIYNSASGVDIRFKAVDGADSYVIWQKSNGVWSAVATVAASAMSTENGSLKYIDTTVKTNYGKGYIYSVAAKIGNVEGLYNTTGLAIYRLEPPTISSATVYDDGQAVIAWNEVNATGYEVSYALSSDTGTWTAAPTTTGTSLTITGLTKGAEYVFRVRCYKTNANRGTTYSQYSSWATGLTVPVLTAIYNSASGADIRFRAVDGADSYVIMQKSNGVWSAVATVKASELATENGSLKYVDTSVKTAYGKGYIYSVAAKKGYSVSAYNTTGLALYRLEPPTISTGKNSASGSVTLTWSATNCQGYEVQYCVSTNTGSWTSAGKVTGTTQTITGLTKGQTYYFRIRCYKTNANRGTTYSQYSSWYKVSVSK